MTENTTDTETDTAIRTKECVDYAYNQYSEIMILAHDFAKNNGEFLTLISTISNALGVHAIALKMIYSEQTQLQATSEFLQRFERNVELAEEKGIIKEIIGGKTTE
jgi:hypothetical protein